MESMPRPRRPYLQKETTRHGKTVWYFRRGKEKRIRLKGAYGSAAFAKAYDEAARGGDTVKQQNVPKHTFRWLVDQYYDSGRFSKLRPNTQRNYRLALEDACKKGGTRAFRKVTTGDIVAGKTRREGKASQAQIYVQVMRAVFKFAIDSNWMKVNPAESISYDPVKSDGFHTWTDDEIEAFRKKHEIDTQARMAMELMLCTGLRVSDAIQVGPQHINNGVLDIKATKNGIDVTIPILPELAECIDAAPKKSNLLFLENARRKPWTVTAFCQWFAKRCDEAGVTEGRAHGLRKAGATDRAQNGASAYELSAMYGWASTKMSDTYTKKANRKKLAEQAANRLSPHRNKSAGNDTK